jgi:hypothetical protein
MHRRLDRIVGCNEPVGGGADLVLQLLFLLRWCMAQENDRLATFL